MKSSFNKTITICILLLSFLSSCKKDPIIPPGSNTGNGDGLEANVIKGDIYDADGNKFKIDGASVIVHVWGPGGIGNGDIMYNIPMDANSHYELPVASGVYFFDASAYMPLNGQIVTIALQSLDNIPSHINQASAPGIIKDFALRLSGLLPGGDPTDAYSYYGAHIWVGDGSANFSSTGYWDNLAVNFPGAGVTFTLTPQSLLIDGSTGETKQISCTVEDLQSGKYLVNIPYAAYRMTAMLTKSNGQQQSLKLSPIPGIQNESDFVDLLFPPDEYGEPVLPEVAVWEN